MRMEPSPPGPIPIIGGGPLGPGAAACRHLVRRLGGGRGLQARPGPGRTSSALAEQRRRAGREDEPFSIYLSLWARPDADLYRSFEEDYGVTDTLCAPAMVAEVDPSDPPEVQLRARLDASARFADEVMAKMR